MRKSRQVVRFYIYVIALIPCLILLVTGIVMLKYHSGAAYESQVMGINGDTWLMLHKVSCIVTIPMVLMHLTVRTDWFKRFFTFKVKGRLKVWNILLFVFFLLCMFTALLSWLIFPDSEIAQMLRGIHNKLGILFIIMFVVHLINY